MKINMNLEACCFKGGHNSIDNELIAAKLGLGKCFDMQNIKAITKSFKSYSAESKKPIIST
jgi:hypothetical protein